MGVDNATLPLLSSPGEPFDFLSVYTAILAVAPIIVNLTEETHGIMRPIPNLQLDLTDFATDIDAKFNLVDHDVTFG